ncbi:MAG: hypothetical protein OEV37_03055 [Candidatus Berkelbacteria bacterium]|nr:hypothetical protein [Candidatus Berkelbacteria bacterium]
MKRICQVKLYLFWVFYQLKDALGDGGNVLDERWWVNATPHHDAGRYSSPSFDLLRHNLTISQEHPHYNKYLDDYVD